jgi:hypothetical protein
MTIGNVLAKEIRNTREKIRVPVVHCDDPIWIVAEKSSLIEWAKSFGDAETKMKLGKEEGDECYFLDHDFDWK